MGRKRNFLALAAVHWLTATLAHPAAAATPVSHRAASHKRHHVRSYSNEPALRSSSVYVWDASNSAVMLAHKSDVAAPIASITKLMTALVVLEAKQPLDEVLEVAGDDRAIGRGAHSRLAVGTKLTRGDLMHLALMSSENRAARALGRNYPGGLPAFVLAMNAKAKALGMSHAHFVDPAGLSCENVASPEDLAKLVMVAANNPTIQQYSTDPDYTVPIRRRMTRFVNTDGLVKKADWNIIVQKTGYITEAGRCLVMQAVIDDRTVVIVLLDSEGKYTRTADATRIKKWMESRRTERLARNT
jgi:D-alanyl-D-alanine endopeptidase (penicillin-binding protein 7)